MTPQETSDIIWNEFGNVEVFSGFRYLDVRKDELYICVKNKMLMVIMTRSLVLV